MELELSQHRDPMESFEDIGDILADELSVDAAAGRSALIGWELPGGPVELTAVVFQSRRPWMR